MLSNLSEASRFINVALVLGALDVKSRANYRMKSNEPWRFHHYKDLAIKTLNRNLSDEQMRTSDVTFQNIFCFLVLEANMTYPSVIGLLANDFPLSYMLQRHQFGSHMLMLSSL